MTLLESARASVPLLEKSCVAASLLERKSACSGEGRASNLNFTSPDSPYPHQMNADNCVVLSGQQRTFSLQR